MSRVSRATMILTALLVSGCAASTPPAPPTAIVSGEPAGPSVTASTTPSAGSGSSGATGSRYTTTKLAIPLTVTVAASLPLTPTDDTPGLLTWTATVVDNNRVRFLVPVEVYPPDATQAIPPPAEFLAYIQGLANKGGVYSDVTTTTIDGVKATVMTARTTLSLDGALGCPVIGADRGEGCFGLQPDYVLRLAVMEVGGKPLLVWARSNSDIPDQAFLAEFEAMLASIDFT